MRKYNLIIIWRTSEAGALRRLHKVQLAMRRQSSRPRLYPANGGRVVGLYSFGLARGHGQCQRGFLVRFVDLVVRALGRQILDDEEAVARAHFFALPHDVQAAKTQRVKKC